MSKFGLHVIAFGGSSRWVDEALSAGSVIIKVCDAPDIARALARRYPDRTVIERRILPESENALSAVMRLGTPGQAAAEWVRRYHAPGDGGPQMTYVEGPNEPVVSSLQEMHWYSAFEAERARIMRSLGFGAIVGNFATGNPADLTLWREAAAMINACRDNPRVLLGLHEYGDYRVRPGADTWNLLRYRRVFEVLAANRLWLPSIVITETGLDRVNSGQLGGGIPWRLAGITESQLASYMDEYDAEIARDPHVLGAVEFTVGGQVPEPWHSEFDLEDAWTYMQHRIAKIKREAVGVLPPPSDFYVVVRGDTLGGIARRYKTTVAELMRLNPQITNPNIIRVGQVIRVRGQVVTPPPPPPAPSGVVYLTREQWGAHTDLPRLGSIVNADRRDRVIIHHTVGIDRSDNTPNAWPSMARVHQAMRGLQVVRSADLGADVPYNYVAFVMDDGSLVICEGRGAHRSGAHTGVGDWNIGAIAVAFHGNFELALPVTIDANLSALGAWLRALRSSDLPRLGDRRPSTARDVYGHRDVYATACPGRNLYGKLDQIKILS